MSEDKDPSLEPTNKPIMPPPPALVTKRPLSSVTSTNDSTDRSTEKKHKCIASIKVKQVTTKIRKFQTSKFSIQELSIQLQPAKESILANTSTKF